jgi:hypothetical protein
VLYGFLGVLGEAGESAAVSCSGGKYAVILHTATAQILTEISRIACVPGKCVPFCLLPSPELGLGLVAREVTMMQRMEKGRN